MVHTFDYQEALLALTTVVAWADGENQDAEVDARVQMIIEEKINDSTFDTFKIKYDEINDFEKLFELAILTLTPLSTEQKSRALAWMWQIANVASEGMQGRLDYIEDVWKNSKENVDLAELQWINRAKKDLKVGIEDFKSSFSKLNKTDRII
jgi:hypothetical protein